MKKFSLIILVLLCVALSHGADKHVLASATPGGNGDTWSTAYNALPATLSRTNIYYIGNGSYGSYTLNDATDGTNYITIRKATVAAHGSATGWSDSYAAQASFGTLGFVTDYQLIDGATRDETNWRSNVYGFRITELQWNEDWHLGGWISDHVTVQYADIGGPASETFDEDHPDNAIYFSSYPSNHIANDITISRCHVHNIDTAFQLAANDGAVVEYCHIGPSWSKEAIRGQNTAKNIIIRYNVFLNASQLVEADVPLYPDGPGRVASSAQVGIWDAGDDSATGNFDGCEIYGNVFAATTAMVETTDAIIFVGSDQATAMPIANNVKVYNNTIVGFQGGLQSGIRLPGGAANEARNNVWHDIEITPVITAAIQSANSNYVSSPFINYAGGNYRLSSAQPGTPLSSPYNTDMDAVTRGGDTVFDIGAYEYVTSASFVSTQTNRMRLSQRIRITDRITDVP